MNKEQLKEKKIAVVGVGGVGGYMAGMLLREFPNVTLTARKQRAEALKENGLIMQSEYSGDSIGKPYAVVDTAELEPQDYIFVCVKNYSLEEACAQLAGAVTEDTVIIPVMNGADPAERTRTYLGKGTVLDSVIYIIAYANPDYSIRQEGPYAYLRIGMEDADERQKKQIEEVAQILTIAGIDYKVSEDIQADIWKKYIFNCAYNVETAYYNNNIGELRADAQKSQEFMDLLEEGYQVAVHKKINIKREDIDFMKWRFREELPDSGTSSLQRDINDGNPTEKEVFGGYLVREAQKAGIRVPVSEKMYVGMQ